MGRRIFSIQSTLRWSVLESKCGSVQVKGEEKKDSRRHGRAHSLVQETRQTRTQEI